MGRQRTERNLILNRLQANKDDCNTMKRRFEEIAGIYAEAEQTHGEPYGPYIAGVLALAEGCDQFRNAIEVYENSFNP